MNKVIIIGRLGQDPKLEYTPTGAAVCTLNVATSEKYTSNNETKTRTEWHRVIVFGKIGENCNLYLKKGSQIYAEGSLRTRSWDENNYKKYFTEVIAKEVTFLDGFPKNETTQPDPAKEPETYTSDNAQWVQDEIPF